MESALRHLNTVAELRQWAEEYEVVDHPQILRLLVALGDSDALMRLQLQGLNDYKSIIEWANCNGITDNVLIRETLLSIVKDNGISIPDNADDYALWELALLVQNRMLPILSIRPKEASANQRTDVNVSRKNGSPIRPDMVGRGDNRDQHPVNEPWRRRRVCRSIYRKTENKLMVRSKEGQTGVGSQIVPIWTKWKYQSLIPTLT